MAAAGGGTAEAYHQAALDDMDMDSLYPAAVLAHDVATAVGGVALVLLRAAVTWTVLTGAVVAGELPDTVLLLEHAAVYTAGKRTEPHERPFDGTPVVDVDRGGKITWHGPGQLVGYPIVRLHEPIDVERCSSCVPSFAGIGKHLPPHGLSGCLA